MKKNTKIIVSTLLVVGVLVCTGAAALPRSNSSIQNANADLKANKTLVVYERN